MASTAHTTSAGARTSIPQAPCPDSETARLGYAINQASLVLTQITAIVELVMHQLEDTSTPWVVDALAGASALAMFQADLLDKLA